VITVDDGFRSAYDIAFPVLKSYGFRATFFIYTDFLGGGRSLTWPLINEMRTSGVIDIQSHSKTHTSFSPGDGEMETSASYAARIKTELEPPKAALERQLGEPVTQLAYPYGDTSRLCGSAAQRTQIFPRRNRRARRQRVVCPPADAQARHGLRQRHDGTI
jgi:peptidoglycan/xylan/chitin deacetylase (PgdA/CDA1 family)